MTTIYHLTSRAEAEAAGDEYTPQAFDSDGFIHCSYADQVTRVANSIFIDEDDLVLLEIDRASLPSKVVDENLEGGDELFPHIYGPLPRSCVLKIHDLPRNEDGRYELPTTIPANR